MEVIIENQNKYRFAWIGPEMKEAQFGSFLFDDPSEARDTEIALKQTLRDCVVWLEDREHNKIEIPR